MVQRGPYVPKAFMDDLKSTLTAEIPDEVTKGADRPRTAEERALKAIELRDQRKRYYDRDLLMLDLWVFLMHHVTNEAAATKEFQVLRDRYLRMAPSDHRTGEVVDA